MNCAIGTAGSGAPIWVALAIIVSLVSSCSCADSDTFTYDANGNMISGSGFNFIYNDADQLAKITKKSDSSTVAEYFYDANGQRVKKTENGITTYYIGDYAETRVSGGSAETTCYYFANNERVARKGPDGSMYYYHGDHLGSTSVVTDGSGALSEEVSYYPYGSVKERVGYGSHHLFTDQEFDDESGLYYYGARYYNPGLTRFIQPDDIIQDVYNPQNLNKYAYVLNNPLKYTDPSGNTYWKGVLGGTAGFVGGGLLVLGGLAVSSTGAGVALGAVMIGAGVPMAGTSAAIAAASAFAGDEHGPAIDKASVIAKAASNPIGVSAMFIATITGSDFETSIKAANVVWDATTMLVQAENGVLKLANHPELFDILTLYEWFTYIMPSDSGEEGEPDKKTTENTDSTTTTATTTYTTTDTAPTTTNIIIWDEEDTRR